MKKYILALLVFVVSDAYAQFEVGAAVSNNGTYQAELNIIDSTIYGNKRTMFTLQKGISLMTYSINSNDNYYYYRGVTSYLPSGNNVYLGTLVRIGTGKQSIITTDFGFGIGLAKTYSTDYVYDPIAGYGTTDYIYEGMETAIGMTWGVDIKIMKNVNTYFKAGGLFREYGDFAAVGFKYKF